MHPLDYFWWLALAVAILVGWRVSRALLGIALMVAGGLVLVHLGWLPLPHLFDTG